VRLGWLINPKQRCVWIYRQGEAPEALDNPVTLSGEAVLPGFGLSTAVIW
jgi:Uma2 family endonuclease